MGARRAPGVLPDRALIAGTSTSERREAPARAPDTEVDPQERAELLLRDLRTQRTGLTSREVVRRLEQHGPNEIGRKASRSQARAVAEQLTHPLALLLWVAAGLALLAGTATLAIAIVAVIALNAVLASVQERQAEHATEALKEFLPAQARVRRDGEVVEIAAADLVPGDILVLEEGDRLSADARLIAGELEVDLSPLTGESQPVQRAADATDATDTLLDAGDLLFAGSLCTGGEAQAVVYATGMGTQVGRIAALSQRVAPEISPLQRQVNRAAWLIAAIAVVIGAVFFVVGISIAGLSLAAALTFAVGLLVANVPEGLLPTITLSLAAGVRQMARRKALLKRLTAVETLGSTDVICTDKTGTLTAGHMAVARLWTLDGEVSLTADAGPPAAPGAALGALLHTATRCNNARAVRDGDGWTQTGDPTESALLVAAATLGEDVEAAQAERDERRRRHLRFDSRRKRMTTLDDEGPDGLWYHSKGAPLVLLERCDAIRDGDETRPLTDDDRRRVADVAAGHAAHGLRGLGFACRPADPATGEEDRDDAESHLVFLGLAALADPPRPEVAAAVRDCQDAGIRIIVITGDDGATAEAIARQVGIVGTDATVVTGAEIDRLGDEELDELLRDDRNLIVARSNPETKLHVVDALRAQGSTVAMTGDGVNDAPALRRADIGIAMGASGTDVAREAATLVLLDDNFASIVAAVAEGRVVYDNIRRFITYIFVHAVPEVAPFVVFALSGGAIPPPLGAMQILAIDLGTDTVPALALGREPAEPGIMRRPPRPRTSGIIDRRMLTRAWLRLGLLEAVLVLGAYFLVLTHGGWSWGDDTSSGTPLHHVYLQATSMVFAGIVACQVGAAFAVRTTHASLRSIGVFTNVPLLRGIAFALIFAAAVVYLPPLQGIFATAALDPWQLLVLLPFPFAVWGSDELYRAWRRRRERLASR